MKKFLVLLLLALPVFASTDTTALTGRVVIGGEGAAGVTVTATSAALMHERTTITGPRGTYWLDSLPPGTYDVTFSRKGAQTVTRRAIVELGRVARADARLELSEEEESVTSTATSMSVAETTFITTHFSDEDLDRLPIPRKLPSAAALAPIASIPLAAVDDGDVFSPELLGEEALHEAAIVRGVAPVDDDRLLLGRTRSGGEEFFLSIRETASRVTHDGDVDHVIETASGGHVIPEKLWFFAAGWAGDAADQQLSDLRGYELKFTAQPGASHNFAGELLKADANDLGSTTGMLRYLGIFGQHLAADATASRTTSDFPALDGNALRANVSYFLPGGTLDHVFTAGGTTSDARDALYANDRLTFERITLDLGARWDDDDLDSGTTTRIAGAYDLRGDGQQAIIASWSGSSTHAASIGYATSLGSGFARADIVRRDGANELQAESRYSLFGRLDLGATYLYADRDGTQRAAAWAGVQLPIGSHELGITLMQRYTELIAPTDIAFRYSIPFTNFGLMIASDVTNVLHREGERAIRLWLRVRV